MQNFFCNKRYDISFTDFSKLIKLILPTDYYLTEARGIYKQDYMPCNIITVTNRENLLEQYNIYCWLGQKGLTVLAKEEFSCSLCIEVLKNIKQNPEDYKILNYTIVDENKLIDLLKENYLVYHQLNSRDNTSKYIIKEYNNDECSIEFYFNPDDLRIYGAQSSLMTYVQLSIEKLLNESKE